MNTHVFEMVKYSFCPSGDTPACKEVINRFLLSILFLNLFFNYNRNNTPNVRTKKNEKLCIDSDFQIIHTILILNECGVGGAFVTSLIT